MAGSPSLQFPEGTRFLLPTRALPAIRLDRAQRNTITAPALASNNGQVLLFNNSNQTRLLVVRCYSAGPALALPVNILYRQGIFGSISAQKNQPLLPDRALLEGQMYQNAGTLFTPDYVDFQGYSNAALATSFPFGVLPPQWGMVWVSQTVNQALTVSVLWEMLTPDEFTEQYGTYA